MTIKAINQIINVTAVSFNRHFEPIPKRIEFGGQTISFVDEGIRFSIKNGQTMTKLFDMSDGQAQFRLRRMYNDRTWELVSISA